MQPTHDLKLMDFIDDLILQIITYGSGETYSSYKEFILIKVAQIKNNPEILDDIDQIIPFCKTSIFKDKLDIETQNSIKDLMKDVYLKYNPSQILESNESKNDIIIDDFFKNKQFTNFIDTILNSLMSVNQKCSCEKCKGLTPHPKLLFPTTPSPLEPNSKEMVPNETKNNKSKDDELLILYE
jgi:hypothetical protein